MAVNRSMPATRSGTGRPRRPAGPHDRRPVGVDEIARPHDLAQPRIARHLHDLRRVEDDVLARRGAIDELEDPIERAGTHPARRHRRRRAGRVSAALDRGGVEVEGSDGLGAHRDHASRIHPRWYGRHVGLISRPPTSSRGRPLRVVPRAAFAQRSSRADARRRRDRPVGEPELDVVEVERQFVAGRSTIGGRRAPPAGTALRRAPRRARATPSVPSRPGARSRSRTAPRPNHDRR